MTRQDIGQQLLRIKKYAVIRLELCLPTIFELGGKKISIIESGSADYNVADLFLYMKMCDVSMELSHWEVFDVKTMEDLREALVYERKESALNITELARLSHVSSNIICAFEDGSCGLKIDTFIKLINALNITVQIS